MPIQYLNGRLVRLTDDEVQSIIDGAVAGSDSGKAKLPPQPAKPALTPEQAKSKAAFEANYKKESAAKVVAEKNRVKTQTAWAKKDNDKDGIPNSIDKTPNGNKPSPTGSGNQPSPTGGGSQNGNTNMATNTPMKTWIANQLRMAGLPDTPANRASLRKEYIDMEEKAAKKAVDDQKAIDKETAAANKIITDKATKKEEDDAEAEETAASNKASYDAIMKSIGGYETNADTAKTDAMKRLADLYNPQAAALGTQKKDQLDLLQKVLGQAGTDINASEQNFLSRLITPSAYTNVPLINMPQQQNALMAALQSQGADTGKVAEQSASDASINNFMQQLLSRSNTQYGNAQTNYVDALRNAGMGAAKSGRDYLSLEQPRLQSNINSKYDDLLASLNTNRADAESDVMSTFQKALADAATAKLEGETKYPQTTTTTIPTTTIPTTTTTSAPAPAFGDGFNNGFDDGINSDIGRYPDDSSGLTYDFTDANSNNPEGLTPEKLKKLQEDLANMFSSGSFGSGFLSR